jgi:hypothetical protein
MWTAAVYLLATFVVPIGLRAQHTPAQNGLAVTDDHNRSPQNGDLAVSAVTVIDGGTYGPDGLPHADIFEMNPDGSELVQINFTPEKDNNAAWGKRP